MTELNYSYELNGGCYNFKLERSHLASNGVVIFMPSAKSKNTKELYPYFPRMKWSASLSDYCVIYVGDPYDKNTAIDGAGSWFFSSFGSCLPNIAALIRHILPGEWGLTMVYGSSMGGYGALILGKLLEVDLILAECPQVDLKKYGGCKWLLEKYLKPEVLSSIWLNIFDFYREVGFPSKGIVDISYNIGDAPHIRYIVEELNNIKNKSMLSAMDPEKLLIQIHPHDSGFGHVNLQVNDGVCRIKNKFLSLKKKTLNACQEVAP